MSKKILLSSFFNAALLFSSSVFAQTEGTLFTLPDTVCVGHEITPGNIYSGAQNYSWTFCPPQFQYVPQGTAYPAPLAINAGNELTIVEGENQAFSGFVANNNGTITRLSFPNGLSGAPLGSLMGDFNGNVPPEPSGIQAVWSGNMWHVFVIGGTTLDNTSIMRMDFGDGLQNAPTNVLNLGNPTGLLEIPNELYFANDDGNWYAFTFNNGTELVRIDFGADLTSLPAATYIGDLGGAFSEASGMTAIVENGVWHGFVTDRVAGTLIRIDFGTDLNNAAPVATNLGTFNASLISPVGISITKGCDEYWGYVLNNGGSGITQIHWSGSIATAPDNHLLMGNIATMVQPTCLTPFVTEDNNLYLFAVNNDNSLSKMWYEPCDAANIEASNELVPPPFKYDTAGWYSVYLTVNQGLPNIETSCRRIYVEPQPPITSKNDTLICIGDTATLFALSNNTDSFVWSPNYNIDTTLGRVVKVWPERTTEYMVTIYYKPTCIIKEPVVVTVSNVHADAGPDRTISDGAETFLGGPNTSLGGSYNYRWFPDTFMLERTDTAYATARPEYDITYYLEVTNADGCRAIDSTIVSVVCDDVHLPNAFTPQSPNSQIATFGLKNRQIVKISYFRIYDRWGKQVFTTTNVGENWDGTIDGKECPMGVYVWEVDAFCNLTGQRYHRSGSVTLLR